MGARWGGARGPRSTSYPRRPHATHRATTRDRPYRSTPEQWCRPRVGIRRIPNVPRPLAMRRKNALTNIKCRGVSRGRPLGRGKGTTFYVISAPPTRHPSGDHKGSPLQVNPRTMVLASRWYSPDSAHPVPFGGRVPKRPVCDQCRGVSCERPLGRGKCNLVLRHIRAAHTPPIGRPQGIAATGHSPGRDTGTNVIPNWGARVMICRLQRLGASAMLGS